MSDLDFMIIGERPDCGGVQEDIDVYAASATAFWERLLAGDDYIQWTLRFGWILHDDGILHAASDHIHESGLTPSAERKLTQAHRGLSLVLLVLDSGDVEAAREQCRAALTTVARWLLIANGIFPFSRDELSDPSARARIFRSRDSTPPTDPRPAPRRRAAHRPGARRTAYKP